MKSSNPTAFPLKNPNPFQVESQITQQNSSTVSLRCPHCRQLGSFTNALNGHSLAYTKYVSVPANSIVTLTASIRLCPNPQCKGIVFTIEQNGQLIVVEPPQLLDFSLDNLPLECQATLKEAILCHAAGAYRAAAIMVRRLLEEICELNGATGSTLHQRLEALKSKVILPQHLFDAMGELKSLGNDATHIEAKVYDNIGLEESEVSIELAKEILKSIYQLKGLVERLQLLKNKK